MKIWTALSASLWTHVRWNFGTVSLVIVCVPFGWNLDRCPSCNMVTNQKKIPKVRERVNIDASQMKICTTSHLSILQVSNEEFQPLDPWIWKRGNILKTCVTAQFEHLYWEVWHGLGNVNLNILGRYIVLYPPVRLACATHQYRGIPHEHFYTLYSLTITGRVRSNLVQCATLHMAHESLYGMPDIIWRVSYGCEIYPLSIDVHQDR